MELLVVYLVIFGAVYLFWLRPQQARRKEAKAELALLEEGDEIVMTSGVYGFITALDGNIVWIEVAPDVELKVTRDSIAGKILADDEEEEIQETSDDSPSDE